MTTCMNKFFAKRKKRGCLIKNPIKSRQKREKCSEIYNLGGFLMRTHRGRTDLEEKSSDDEREVYKGTPSEETAIEKKRIQTEKTVGFQPRYHLNTYITKVEALFQCLHSFFSVIPKCDSPFLVHLQGFNPAMHRVPT